MGLAVNLAFVGQKPTGLATYALNLVPQLDLPLTLLAAAEVLPQFQAVPSLQTTCPVPADLTYEQGKLGHLRRLTWTQLRLPRLYRQSQASLLFSPVPELPLGGAIPAVVMVHDLIPLRFPRLTSPLTQYFRYYVPQVLQQARHVICNSQATAQDIRDYFQIPAAKITPIPLAHDAAHFRPLNRESAAPDASIPDPADPPYFIYLGRQDPYKNLARLIRAFAALPSGYSDYRLYLVGSADPRFAPALQLQAEQLGLGDRVKFLDYVPYSQLPSLLSRAVAMVYPSLWEGFGFPVLEAMACGTPVVCSNRASLPEVVGDAAILVDPLSEAELTAALQQVTEPTTQIQLRRAGLARASQFSWTKTGQATCEVLRQFL
ncbi:MAG: glycosyltransferase family 4 protein [Elainella sp.]